MLPMKVDSLRGRPHIVLYWRLEANSFLHRGVNLLRVSQELLALSHLVAQKVQSVAEKCSRSASSGINEEHAHIERDLKSVRFRDADAPAVV